MKSNAWRALALLSLTVFVLATFTDANAARRSSLGGNQHIDDHDDMFAFPHLLLKYKNSVIVDFVPSNSLSSEWPDGSMAGRGTITFGSDNNDWAWQFNTGRGDYLNNTAWWAWGGFDRALDFGSPFSNPSSGVFVQWWDLGVAKTFGTSDWGLTVSWASDVDQTTPEGQPATEDETTSMTSFQLGTNVLFNADWALEFGTGSHKDKITTDNDFDFSEFALAVRGAPFTSGGITWRWMLAFASETAEPKLADTEKYSVSGFRGNFGPVWGTPGDWLISAYLYFDYLTAAEPYAAGDNSKETMTNITIPGYNIAMEYYFNAWLCMRGSIFSHYAMETLKVEGHATDNGEEKNRYYSAFWTVGLGIDKEVFGLDLALEEDNFHTGYVFGNSNDVDNNVLALITAWVRW